MRWLVVVIVAAMLPGVVAAQTPVASPVIDLGCDEIVVYMVRVAQVVDDVPLTDDERKRLDILEDKAPIDLRPSELRFLARVFDDVVTALKTIPIEDIPMAMVPYHDARIDAMSIYTNLFVSMAASGAFGALPYTDSLEDANAAMEDAERFGENACGSQWPDDLSLPML